MSFAGPGGGGGFTKLSGDLGPNGTNVRIGSTFYTAAKPTLVMVSFHFPGTGELEIAQGTMGPDQSNLIGPVLASCVTGSGQQSQSFSFFVPQGYVYAVALTGNVTIDQWAEAT
jgi:hypothetical protein